MQKGVGDLAEGQVKSEERSFDALADTIDFRDAMFTPTLVHVPPVSAIEAYREGRIPVLDQGKEGACTGFALATVANFLLRIRDKNPNADEVSAWMLYTMARRYDEWPGEDYSGSSARGAMKGWYKHGLCARKFWESAEPDLSLAEQRAADAIERPLGAYFRVNHKDLVAMHSAINEVGILFATGLVHRGWQDLATGVDRIPYDDPLPAPVGGHAFAIVGYDRDGFWVQNSWGLEWGRDGIALLSYDDWLANGSDVWVAALGAPVHLRQAAASAAIRSGAPNRYQSQIVADLRRHVIVSKNDGILEDKGDYGLTPASLGSLLTNDVPARMQAWKSKRLLLYAHGGLVSLDSAIQTVANNRDALLQGEVYPLSFVWRSDAWTTLKNILQEAIGRRSDLTFLDSAKDFMIERLDGTLEAAARLFGGKTLWDEMKENALRATTGEMGAGRLVADHVAALLRDGTIGEIHLVGHSAGSIFHGPLATRLVKAGATIESLTLWAPACSIDFFGKYYRPLIDAGEIKRFNLFTLDDATERDDDCAGIYHKSLLYLVSHAFEAKARIPLIQPGTPLLGLERDVKEALQDIWKGTPHKWIVAPGEKSRALHHGDFDNDRLTLLATLQNILGGRVKEAARRSAFKPRQISAGRQQRLRAGLDHAITS
jgi:hypothetical protein